MQLFEIRESKRRWAINHPDQVRQANKIWRQTHRTRTNAQAAVRMRRYRARKKKLAAGLR